MVDSRYLRNDIDSIFAHAMEECGEFMAAAGKTLRWGPDSSNPAEIDGITNVVWMYREALDLRLTMGRLITALEDEFNLHDGC